MYFIDTSFHRKFMPSTMLAYSRDKVLLFQILNLIFGHVGEGVIWSVEEIQRPNCFPHPFYLLLLFLYTQSQRYLVASSCALRGFSGVQRIVLSFLS